MSTYLMHSGRKNQKWGVRRWQNKDGSLTPAGRIHYGVGKSRDKKGKKGDKDKEDINKTLMDRAKKMMSDAEKSTGDGKTRKGPKITLGKRKTTEDQKDEKKTESSDKKTTSSDAKKSDSKIVNFPNSNTKTESSDGKATDSKETPKTDAKTSLKDRLTGKKTPDPQAQAQAEAAARKKAEERARKLDEKNRKREATSTALRSGSQLSRTLANVQTERLKDDKAEFMKNLDVSDVSTAELKKRIDRMNTERTYKQLMADNAEYKRQTTIKRLQMIGQVSAVGADVVALYAAIQKYRRR